MNRYFPFIRMAVGAVGLLFFFTGCQKEENVRTSTPKPERKMETLQGKVVHLHRDTVYILSQSFNRNNEEQLIIDEGTIIKVNVTQAPSITINAGAIIRANGTQNNPVVFTSSSLPGDQRSSWGGLIINGKSVSNASNPNGDIGDSSGVLNYVRIEFANLVLNQVGNRTLIDNIQVSYSGTRSAFEIHGGTFNGKHLISYASGGSSDFYITKGYRGNLQHLLAYRHPYFGSRGSNPFNALAGVFIENNPVDPVGARPYTYPIISNLTVLGPNALYGSTAAYNDTIFPAAALVTTGSTGFRIRNTVLAGFPRGAWYLGDSLTGYGVVQNFSELTYCLLHSNDSARTFYLKPNIFGPFTSADFRDYMLDPLFHNEVIPDFATFGWQDPFNYDVSPNPLPKNDSPVLAGANFDGPDYSHSFFNKVNYKGALGTDTWMQGWTNFLPLKTEYNVPK